VGETSSVGTQLIWKFSKVCSISQTVHACMYVMYVNMYAYVREYICLCVLDFLCYCYSVCSENTKIDFCILALNFRRLTDWLIDWLLICCRPSTAQWFLVPSSTELIAIFCCLTVLGAFRPVSTLQFVPHKKHITFPLFGEKIAAYRENHKKHTGPLCRQNQNFNTLKQVVYIRTAYFLCNTLNTCKDTPVRSIF
jgi:hypothetical protein